MDCEETVDGLIQTSHMIEDTDVLWKLIDTW